MDPSKTISEEEKTALVIGSGEVDVSEDSTGKDALAAGDVSQQGSGPPSSSGPTAGVIRYNSTPSGTLPSGDCMQAYKIENINMAVDECKSKLIKPELDGEFCRAWLLTEIDHWNLDKEKLILLTDNSLLVVKFDFIKVHISSSRRIFLQAIERLQIGDLVFPPKSFMTPRNQTGIRIHFGKMSDMPFGQRWNPFSETVPFITLTNHPLFLCKTETTMHSIDDLISLLIRGIDGVRARSGQSEQFHVVEEGPILIESYAGIVSMLHNQSKLGYLNRGRSIDFWTVPRISESGT